MDPSICTLGSSCIENSMSFLMCLYDQHVPYFIKRCRCNEQLPAGTCSSPVFGPSVPSVLGTTLHLLEKLAQLGIATKQKRLLRSHTKHERRFSHSLSPTSMCSIRHLGFEGDRAISDMTGNLIRPAEAIGSRASETYNKVRIWSPHPFVARGRCGSRAARDLLPTSLHVAHSFCASFQKPVRELFVPTSSQPPSRGNGSPGHWHCKADMAATYSEGDLPRIQP